MHEAAQAELLKRAGNPLAGLSSSLHPAVQGSAFLRPFTPSILNIPPVIRSCANQRRLQQIQGSPHIDASESKSAGLPERAGNQRS